MNAPSLEMNAITVEAGEAERLAVRRVVGRAARPGEVTVRVTAISLNRGEVKRALTETPSGTTPGWDFAPALSRISRIWSWRARGGVVRLVKLGCLVRNGHVRSVARSRVISAKAEPSPSPKRRGLGRKPVSRPTHANGQVEDLMKVCEESFSQLQT